MDNVDVPWMLVGSKHIKSIKKHKIIYFDRQSVINKLKYVSQYNIRSAFLYGSVARGTHNDSSDIDILLIWNKHVPNTIPEKIKHELSSLFQRKIDLVSMIYKKQLMLDSDIDDEYDQHANFLNNVMSDAIPIYGTIDDIRFSSYASKN